MTTTTTADPAAPSEWQYKKPSDVTLRLRASTWDDLCDSRQFMRESFIAAIVGVNTSHLYRLRHGQSRPGTKFIARAMSAFNDLSFDQLFEIVESTEEKA